VPKNNRTVWTEGMFLGPHHFQQQDRFLLASVSGINSGRGEFSYGFTSVEVDGNMLSEGKFSLKSAKGIFPDGTPFSLPEDDDLPDAVDIDANTRDQVVSLAVPFSVHSEKDIAEKKSRESFSRFLLKDQVVRDRHSPDSDSEETVFTAGLWTRLILETNDQNAFHTIPVARVAERREDGTVILDKDFFPCSLSLKASEQIINRCGEMQGLLQQRATELAGKLGSPNASDSSQLIQLLLLQLINRAKPFMQHIAQSAPGHPEELFRELLKFAGEFSTLTTNERVAPDFPEYLHRDQFTSFNPVFSSLRDSLNWIPDTTTESYPVKHMKAGAYLSSVKELNLFAEARFILAVKATATPDEIQKNFPRNTTISSTDKLRDLVRAQARGIELKTLTHVPGSIPTYENYVYFEMRQDDELWKDISRSGDIALHISGTFADLNMQLWTIQR